jgi:hypothetical protein
MNAINSNTMSNPLQLNQQLKKEADALLHEKGLLRILQSSGTPHVHGSYTLDLMTWRDLDIYLEAEAITEEELFALGSRICSVLQPVKMSFRNERLAKTEGLPFGLYWGIYLGNERAGAWKIDIWAVDAAECGRLLAFNEKIRQDLTPGAVSRILHIKSQCWQDPAYRRSYSSTDIYEAVLRHNIDSLEGFSNFLRQRNSNPDRQV